MTMKWQGFCIYPHGCFMTLALSIVIFAATGATISAAMSCRFFVLSYESNYDNFQDALLEIAIPTSMDLPRRAGLGLFRWLDTSSSESSSPNDYTKGVCVSWTVDELDKLNDSTFSAARFLTIFAVMMSIVACCWVFLFGCLSFGTLHMVALSCLLQLQVILTGMSFIMSQSAACTTIGTTESLPSSCSIDEGALIMIAACILWFVSFVLAFFFVDGIAEEDDQVLGPPGMLFLDNATSTTSSGRKSSSRQRQQQHCRSSKRSSANKTEEERAAERRLRRTLRKKQERERAAKKSLSSSSPSRKKKQPTSEHNPYMSPSEVVEYYDDDNASASYEVSYTSSPVYSPSRRRNQTDLDSMLTPETATASYTSPMSMIEIDTGADDEYNNVYGNHRGRSSSNLRHMDTGGTEVYLKRNLDESDYADI